MLCIRAPELVYLLVASMSMALINFKNVNVQKKSSS